jgi:putative nucleotidyltransferase with HDIG domain
VPSLDERTRGLIRQRIVSRVKDIPSLPQMVLQTLKKLDDPKSSAADVAGRLSRDEGLVLRVLKLANSAYYGMPRRVSSVTEAISYLGYRTVKSLVLAASVFQHMDKPLAGYALDRGDLWRHSQAVAASSRHIAGKVRGQKIVDPEEAYIAGMLHDIGKIVLNDYIRFGYGLIVRMVEEEQVPFMEAERGVLGFDHAEVGAQLIEQWQLPPSFVAVARYHHEPELLPEEASPGERVLLDVVHVANVMTLMLGAGLGADGLQYPLSEAALERLAVDEPELLMAELVDCITALDEELPLEGAR